MPAEGRTTPIPDGGILALVQHIHPGDWRTLEHLRLSALRDSPLTFFGSLQAEAERGPRAWRQACDESYWLSATVGDDHVGLAGVVDYPAEDPRFHVEGMWVDPRYRKTGVGMRLLQAAETYALSSGQNRLGLWIISGSSHPALALYQRCGYSPTGRTAVVPDGREEFEYAKTLG